MPLALRPWLAAALALSTVMAIGTRVSAQSPTADIVQRIGGFAQTPQPDDRPVGSIEHVSRRVTPRAAQTWLTLQKPVKAAVPRSGVAPASLRFGR